MSSACPHCQQIDQVQKVSAIVSAGRTTSSGTISHPRSVSLTDSTSITDLATRLSPPPMPQGSCLSTLAFFGGLLGTGVMVLVGCFGGALVSAIFNLQGNSHSIPFTQMLIGAILGPILFLLSIKRLREFVQQRWPDQKLIAWDRAMQRWRHLFYCSRCDCVFFPDTDVGASADRMRSFLYAEELL